MSDTNNIMASLQQAAEQAGKMAGAPQTTGTDLVVQDSTPPAPVNLASFRANAKPSVTNYLKVNENGMKIGSNPGLVETFEGKIDFSKLRPCLQVRFGKNPVKYYKSFDGRRSVDGQLWTAVVAQAKQVEPGRTSDPYSTVEMVIEVTADVKDIKGGVVAKAGDRLGYTPPFTGTGYVGELLNAAEAAGFNPNTATVDVIVTAKSEAKGSNTWGNVIFTLKQ